MLNFHAGQDELPQFLNTELLFPRANRSTEKYDLVVVAWYWLQAKLASLQTTLHPNQLHQSEKSPKAPRLLIHIFHYTRQTIYYYVLWVQLNSCKDWSLNQDPKKRLSLFRTDFTIFTAQIRKEVNHICRAELGMERENSCRCSPNLFLLL